MTPFFLKHFVTCTLFFSMLLPLCHNAVLTYNSTEVLKAQNNKHYFQS